MDISACCAMLMTMLTAASTANLRRVLVAMAARKSFLFVACAVFLLTLRILWEPRCTPMQSKMWTMQLGICSLALPFDNLCQGMFHGDMTHDDTFCNGSTMMQDIRFGVCCG